jgi:hypothetical protein
MTFPCQQMPGDAARQFNQRRRPRLLVPGVAVRSMTISGMAAADPLSCDIP